MTNIRYAARPPLDQHDLESTVATNPIVTDALMVTFHTDPDVVAAVLPRPLAPAPEALATVAVQKVTMSGREFGSAVIAVACSHEGVVGSYPLLMPQSIEQSLVGGRETYGEPKKLADISLERDGDRVHAAVARMGFDLVDITGTVTGSATPPDDEVVNLEWYFKFFKDPSGHGITHPHLIECTYRRRILTLETVDATLTLGESPLDPIRDLPIRSIRDTTYITRRTSQVGRYVRDVPAEWIEPFAHQRYDDMAAFSAAAARDTADV